MRFFDDLFSLKFLHQNSVSKNGWYETNLRLILRSKPLTTQHEVGQRILLVPFDAILCLTHNF